MIDIDETTAPAFASALDTLPTDPPLDRIFLRDHIREVEIGAFRQERGGSQRVRFDLVVEVLPVREGDRGDDVDEILSYDVLIAAIDHGLAVERLNLLETLAEGIAANVLGHPQAARIFLRIAKPDLGPHLLGIEIVRTRDQLPPRDHLPTPSPPRVAVLPAGAPKDAGLRPFMRRLMKDTTPTVLIALPDVAPRAAATVTAQREIDLLAMDQAAWIFAASAPDCTVVDNRTELDALMRKGALVVWAPARMVRGAARPPDGVTPLDLAHWLAATLDATDVVTPFPPRDGARQAADLSEI